MENLKLSIEKFIKISERYYPSEAIGFHITISQIHNICAAIGEAINNGNNKEHVVAELEDIRKIHSRSPFINRLQNWPRGYPGDFETIEYICDGINKAKKGSFEYYLEWYALNSAIAQQHRNKIGIQSDYIADIITKNDNAQILIIGCGSGRDIRKISNIIERSNSRIYLNDIDKAAIAFTKAKMNNCLLSKAVFIEDNVVNLARNWNKFNMMFDLILCGGVFDYLSDKSVIFVLKNMYANLLKNNGKIIFTNINRENPFKFWIEYLANWTLIERDADDCITVCKNANIPENNFKTYQEETGLTLITEICKNNTEINELSD